MLFNSIDFAIFLPIVFVVYWLIPNNNYRIQNILIVLASYIFYGWWDWRFLSLIFISSLVDFYIGYALSNELNILKRKILILFSVIMNLGILGFFKYYNFFLDNFIHAFSFLGIQFTATSLNIILPVGISFYTFQTLSYSIDVYKKKLEPTKNFVAFLAYVSFFPQLVAGPIERAKNLLPQFYFKRKFEYSLAVEGMRQILWGLFKKVVIADNCADYANLIFNNSDQYSGSTLVIGAIFFSFQIYGDFSGYSDIAIGTSRLFGFNLKKNFSYPYFSRDIAEFWRRWHISLSTWFRDYLYIPLGGSKVSLTKQIRNTLIVFIISGFWHGANWTFIIWGGLNALFFIPYVLLNRNRKHLDVVSFGRFFPSFNQLTHMILTFILVSLTWIFFRAENLDHAVNIFQEIFSPSIMSLPQLRPTSLFILIAIFTIVEWLGREEDFALSKLDLRMNKSWRYLVYYMIIFAIFWLGGEEQEFLYFRF